MAKDKSSGDTFQGRKITWLDALNDGLDRPGSNRSILRACSATVAIRKDSRYRPVGVQGDRLPEKHKSPSLAQNVDIHSLDRLGRGVDESIDSLISSLNHSKAGGRVEKNAFDKRLDCRKA